MLRRKRHEQRASAAANPIWQKACNHQQYVPCVTSGEVAQGTLH
ncbi:hypothetical protein BIFANG_02170 [Bifidobacterium angulatum DSM 20098 = JCM 7096]|uniref:Uncharacterized protein n=1 Tax=Bifidobacterium angulatum DSM 20098 = JCM 7096 TaxID=518635 RepID=C4FCZ2_9BIFI|nr:hypothetical protein BIFANG_02170 [Bifidobacterium angulatum DSM 20098 = JCM 7096]